MSITNRIYSVIFSHLGFLPQYMKETKFFEHIVCGKKPIDQFLVNKMRSASVSECVFVCSCTFYFFALVYENLINRDDYLLQFSFTSLDKEKPPKSANTVFCTVCDTITVLNTPTRALYEFCSVLSAAKLVPHNKRIQPSSIRLEPSIRSRLPLYFHLGFRNYHLLWFVFAKKYELWLWWCDAYIFWSFLRLFSCMRVLQSFHICKIENAMTITFSNTFESHSKHCVNKH